MHLRLAFLHTVDERFLVLSEIVPAVPSSRPVTFSLTTFDHENTFLKLAATIDLPRETTVSIISDVLLSVAQPTFPHRWLDLEISEEARAALGLHAESVEASYLVDEHPIEEAYDVREPGPDESRLFGFSDENEQFHQFLMQAPTPFVMLTGPEHRMSFINPPYIRLLSRLNADSMLGKPVREALPELEGQPFFGLLDQVYRTGKPFVGTEVPLKLKSEATGSYQDSFVDFIYHPVRDHAGTVRGIMVQAMEVTERVLSREVANNREQQLYDQWLELEAIYKTAPLGVVLFDAKDMKILRINETQAEFMGSPVNDLMGKRAKSIAFKVPEYKKLIERVMSGETVRNTLIETGHSIAEAGQRRWLVNITPFRSPVGVVEKVCSISLEIPQELAVTN